MEWDWLAIGDGDRFDGESSGALVGELSERD
jgi:hypothetical protein